jgi:2-polyprenyl-3-methyl-5-hydroxy-6-metoxy-1,4-benzoquinol methylase
MSDDNVVEPPHFQRKLTAEEAYRRGTDFQFESEELTLGPWTSLSIKTDPKHLLFTLARYKFAAKMIDGKKSVMDLGPGDGPGLPILSQAAKHVLAVDWDIRLIDGNKRRLKDFTNIDHYCYNVNTEDIPLANLDACVSIDVLEHIDPVNEDKFMRRICKCLKPEGVVVIGTPNKHANIHASPQSQIQHINLHTMESLKETVGEYFYNVFSFAQNDEVITTGYSKMAHYIWAVGASVKTKYLL